VASSPDSSVGAVDALVAALDGLEAVDLSPTLRSAMPRFFAHPEFHIIDDARLIERDNYRLQTLVLPEHVGPHVDAPAHVVAERPEATVDTLDVTALWGRAVVVDVSDRDWKAGDLLDVTTSWASRPTAAPRSARTTSCSSTSAGAATCATADPA
jgi:kynurenine formamidase